ncbi:MAG: hypothetical protein M0R30_13520 [Methanoregula sp.]|jgi:hypothetical protein|uniref:hypothetical protein n=1 Tax=Methanoregula sp. TaxID=2052170 RepID=UPI0025D80BFD|nr:hypothetical protein [Methanoregula sp.]MCK9632645.1 hypothetical protein [Methanoregula sp.]
MKKKYLTYAGTVAAALLVVLFAGILLSGSFSVFSSVTIDPIPDQVAGDLVVITGTTNLMAGTVLDLDIIAVSPAPGTKSPAGTVDAFIVRGGGMSNTWSAELNTVSLSPGEYIVNAYWINGTVRSDLLATSRFRLNDTGLARKDTSGTGPDQSTFITVNPPGTVWRGETMLVTGTTNLPAGTGLHYLVIRQSNTSALTVDPKGGFTRAGIINVLPGIDGINRWSFAVDTGEFIAGQYKVIVTQHTISTDDPGKAEPSGTAPFEVKEAILHNSTPAVPDGSPCGVITIDAFPDRWINQTFTITGTTSFPPGTGLLVQVYPTAYDLTMNMGIKYPAATLSGATAQVTVERGNGSDNLWFMTLDKGRMDPNQPNYLVNVSNDRIDHQTYATIYGDTYCSKRLVLPD